tara:strand:+ start:965 stop:1450 length:486 start_codon:yes stop_codon:yes gene_type:complete
MTTHKCIYPPLPEKNDLIYFLESYYYPYNLTDFKEFIFQKGDLIKIGYVNQSNNIIKLHLPNVKTKGIENDRYTYTYTSEKLDKYLNESKGINWIESGIIAKCRILPASIKYLFMKDKTTYKVRFNKGSSNKGSSNKNRSLASRKSKRLKKGKKTKRNTKR